MPNLPNTIYHEKQVRSLCALHTLNNLLQDPRAFDQNELDNICSRLSPGTWVNPHKSVLGLGDYDINVITAALQKKGLDLIWFDKRKDPSVILNFSAIFGFILNIPSDSKLGWLMRRKHWVAIRKLPLETKNDVDKVLPEDIHSSKSIQKYVNLDSKFEQPDIIGDETQLLEFLKKELKSPDKELFIVVTENVSQDSSWRKENESSS